MASKLIFQDRDDCNASVIILNHLMRTEYSTEVRKVKGLAILCPDNLEGYFDFHILPTFAHLISLFLINKKYRV